MEITEKELEVVLTENPVVVVDFWAPWCGPCRMMKPTYAEFAENNPGVAIHTVSADDNEGVGQNFKIKSLPTFVFFKDGVEVDRLSGRQQLKELQEKLDAHV